jgi:hypothetical protein
MNTVHSHLFNKKTNFSEKRGIIKKFFFFYAKFKQAEWVFSTFILVFEDNKKKENIDDQKLSGEYTTRK